MAARLLDEYSQSCRKLNFQLSLRAQRGVSQRPDLSSLIVVGCVSSGSSRRARRLSPSSRSPRDPRRARAQSQERRSRDSARRSSIVFTGAVGLGQILARLRHHLCRGPAPLRRELSAYARQFLEMMQKPDVDQIDGLSPAISIEQKTTSRTRARPSARSPRSTTTCACCGRASACPIRPRPACRSKARPSAQMVDRVLALPEGARLYLLAPVVRGRKGEYKKELAEWQKKGFQRVKIDGDLLRDRRRARARQEIQARHRRRGGPHRGRGDIATRSPTVSRPR
jgi:hypothetical protein